MLKNNSQGRAGQAWLFCTALDISWASWAGDWRALLQEESPLHPGCQAGAGCQPGAQQAVAKGLGSSACRTVQASS